MLSSVKDPLIQVCLDQATKPHQISVEVDGRTVTMRKPFPSPDDWRDIPIYFVLIDRFNNPVAMPASSPWNAPATVFQGGTFEGIRQRLDYIKELGFRAIWLSPILKNCMYNPYSYHGYGIQNFLTVDPRFSSNPTRARKDPRFAELELERLINDAHARGLYVIFDIVLNHTGDVFEYTGFGSTAPWVREPYRVAWRDANGSPRSDWPEPPLDAPPEAAILPLELRRNEFFRRRGQGDEANGDFSSLKELVTEYYENDPVYGAAFPVREILIKTYQYLLARFDPDGYRIDTLKYVEPDFALEFGNDIREYALSIGKKNFFTFGEVYDNEDMISRYIGRNASECSDLIGVDAALDFPLFFRLPDVVKGQLPPTKLVEMYSYRHKAQRGIISSQGEASNFFVTFLDNHDQYHRFYFSDPQNPHRYDDQMALGIGCLFTLLGIPCLYYGTEQGLSGSGKQLESVREALWGKPDAFNEKHPFYQAIKKIAAVRAAQPALRYGRQYFRPVSGDGVHFGISRNVEGILAYSRLLSDEEIVIVANTSVSADWEGDVLIDYDLNARTRFYDLLYCNHETLKEVAVLDKTNRKAVVQLEDGSMNSGPVRVIHLKMKPMEIQILRNRI
ncbi:MAG: alpha-amylase [Leptolinea sp.]|jgi:glycosidase|nr:alpha-amylase [Leptolinea sp.]